MDFTIVHVDDDYAFEDGDDSIPTSFYLDFKSSAKTNRDCFPSKNKEHFVLIRNESISWLLVKVFPFALDSFENRIGQGKKQRSIAPGEDRLIEMNRKFSIELFEIEGNNSSARAEEFETKKSEPILLKKLFQGSISRETSCLTLRPRLPGEFATDPKSDMLLAFGAIPPRYDLLLARRWSKTLRKFETENHYETLGLTKLSEEEEKQLEKDDYKFSAEKQRIDQALLLRCLEAATSIEQQRAKDDADKIPQRHRVRRSLCRIASVLQVAASELSDGAKRKRHNLTMALRKGLWHLESWSVWWNERSTAGKAKVIAFSLLTAGAVAVAAAGSTLTAGMSIWSVAGVIGLTCGIGTGSFMSLVYAMKSKCLLEEIDGNKWTAKQLLINFAVGVLIGSLAGAGGVAVPNVAMALSASAELDPIVAMALVSAGFGAIDAMAAKFLQSVSEDFKNIHETPGAFALDLLLAGSLGALLGLAITGIFETVSPTIRQQLIEVGQTDEVIFALGGIYSTQCRDKLLYYPVPKGFKAMTSNVWRHVGPSRRSINTDHLLNQQPLPDDDPVNFEAIDVTSITDDMRIAVKSMLQHNFAALKQQQLAGCQNLNGNLPACLFHFRNKLKLNARCRMKVSVFDDNDLLKMERSADAGELIVLPKSLVTIGNRLTVSFETMVRPNVWRSVVMYDHVDRKYVRESDRKWKHHTFVYEVAKEEVLPIKRNFIVVGWLNYERVHAAFDEADHFMVRYDNDDLTLKDASKN